MGMTKLLKNVFLVLIVVSLFFSVSIFVVAEPLLVVEINSFDNPSFISDVYVSELNDFEDPRLFEDHAEDNEDLRIITEDSAGNIIYDVSASGMRTFLLYSPKISNVKLVYRNKDNNLPKDKLLDSKLVTFCNNNGICEPCFNSGCFLNENTITCDDCKSGSFDLFCDTILDGICDPDCDGDLSDSDCGVSCNQLKGTICQDSDDCISGFFTTTVDSEFCCLGGLCGNLEEYIMLNTALVSQPALVLTGNTSVASIQNSGIASYCVENLGGSFCGFGEVCSGKSVEYYPDVSCCLGSCLSYSQDQFGNTPKDLEGFRDIDSGLSEKDIEGLFYDPSIVANNKFDIEMTVLSEELQDVVLSEEMLDDQFSGELPDSVGVDDRFDDYGPPLSLEDDSSGVSEVIDNVGDVANEVFTSVGDKVSDWVPAGKVDSYYKVNWLVVLFIVIAVIILLIVSLVLAKKNAFNVINKEKSILERNDSFKNIKSSSYLENEISVLVSKGFNYNQIQSILVKKGYDPLFVNSEIRNHYQSSLK